MKCKICNKEITERRWVYCSKECAKEADLMKSKIQQKIRKLQEQRFREASKEEQLNLMMLKVKEIMKSWY